MDIASSKSAQVITMLLDGQSLIRTFGHLPHNRPRPAIVIDTSVSPIQALYVASFFRVCFEAALVACSWLLHIYKLGMTLDFNVIDDNVHMLVCACATKGILSLSTLSYACCTVSQHFGAKTKSYLSYKNGNLLT